MRTEVRKFAGHILKKLAAIDHVDDITDEQFQVVQEELGIILESYGIQKMMHPTVYRIEADLREIPAAQGDTLTIFNDPAADIEAPAPLSVSTVVLYGSSSQKYLLRKVTDGIIERSNEANHSDVIPAFFYYEKNHPTDDNPNQFPLLRFDASLRNPTLTHIRLTYAHFMKQFPSRGEIDLPEGMTPALQARGMVELANVFGLEVTPYMIHSADEKESDLRNINNRPRTTRTDENFETIYPAFDRWLY